MAKFCGFEKKPNIFQTVMLGASIFGIGLEFSSDKFSEHNLFGTIKNRIIWRKNCNFSELFMLCGNRQMLPVWHGFLFLEPQPNLILAHD